MSGEICANCNGKENMRRIIYGGTTDGFLDGYICQECLDDFAIEHAKDFLRWYAKHGDWCKETTPTESDRG